MRGILAEGHFSVAREILDFFIIALTAGGFISMILYSVTRCLDL